MNPNRPYYLLNRTNMAMSQAHAALARLKSAKFTLVAHLFFARTQSATRVLLHEVLKRHE